jgi:hypothetical protein
MGWLSAPPGDGGTSASYCPLLITVRIRSESWAAGLRIGGKMARGTNPVVVVVLTSAMAAAVCIGGGKASASSEGAPQQNYTRQSPPPATSPSNCGQYPCFNTADELLASTPHPHPGNLATIPLASREIGPGPRDPRMLVGLDNGPRGYWPASDGYAQGRSGTVGNANTGNVYNFDHWQYLDNLYYYYHALTSVPPTQWTNAGHRNGVPVLGTVTADCNGCGDQATMLFDPAHYHETVEKLYQYAVAYGFDGWVIDMEQAPTGDSFDPSPTVLAAVKEMLNKKLPNGQNMRVSVYHAHQTSLQPGPQDMMTPFIQAGAAWQSDYDSSAQPGPTNPAAKTYNTLQGEGLAARRFDAYWASYVYRPFGESACAGDVTTAQQIWNGNSNPPTTPTCLNTQNLFDNQRLIVNPAPALPRYFTSAALFAPEWTYFGNLPDPLPGQVAVGPASRTLAHAADDALWVGHDVRYSGPQCTRSGTNNAVSSYISPRSVVGSLPFVTNFNEGEGDSYAVGGKLAAAIPWNNLSSQDVLPTWHCATSGNLTAASTYASPDNNDAYNGGSALGFTGNGGGEFGLYATKIAIPNGANPVLSFVAKTKGGPAPYARVYFGDGTSQTVQATRSGSGWQEFGGRLHAPGKTIVKISVGFPNTNRPVNTMLGQLRLYDSSTDQKPSPIKVSSTASTISWRKPANPPIAYWNVYARRGRCLNFLGPAFTTSYDTKQPMYGPPQPAANYVIQPVSTNGSAATVGDVCRGDR